jgi:hypothetical protein
MTVPKIDPVNNYAGNGSTTTFDFDFLIESSSELLVQHTNNLGVQTTLVYDTDYTINTIGNENGSYITFPKAGSTYSTLESDEILSITPNLDIKQEKEIRNSGKLNLDVMEWCLDYITRILQVHSRKIERSVKIQEGSSQTSDELVEALQQAQVNASASATAAATSASNSATSASNAEQSKDDILEDTGFIAVSSDLTGVNNIGTVASNITNVNSVGVNISNVNAVAGNETNINAVNANKTNIDNVAGNMSNITTCVNNMTDIQNAEENAAIAAEEAERARGFSELIFDTIRTAYKDFLAAGSTHTKIKLRKTTFIKCPFTSGTKYLSNPTDIEFDVIAKLDTGSALTAGKDYSIYLVEDPAETEGIGIKVSLNGTYPTGYTAANSFKIGGFHTLCAAVTAGNAPALVDTNIWASHPAVGYAAADIIPNSVWCLTHRPISNPNGMVFVNKLNLWVDIYLQSGTGTSTTSAYGATVTDTRAEIHHKWDMNLVYKRAPKSDEFSVFAEGSNQKTAIYGSAAPSPKTAGGHIDTSSKRMISGYFIEECCGFLWQWLDEIGVNGGSVWVTQGDGDTRGQHYGTLPYVLLAGGDWGGAASCGSRCRNSGRVRSHVAVAFGCRGVSQPLSFPASYGYAG